jgi:hypothetical protein
MIAPDEKIHSDLKSYPHLFLKQDEDHAYYPRRRLFWPENLWKNLSLFANSMQTKSL